MNNSQAFLWQKFLHDNGDLSRKALDTANTRIRQEKKQLNRTEQRLVELFTMQDTGTFINCCLEIREEFKRLEVFKKL